MIFKGGVNYKNTINVNWSGVTYDGNSAGTWGGGKAIMNGGIPSGTTAIDFTNLLYGFHTGSQRGALAFRNFKFLNYGGHPNTNAWLATNPISSLYGYGIYLYSPTNVTIANCDFSSMGDWQNTITNINGNYMEGEGIKLYRSPQNITVTNCDFTQCGRSGVDVNVYGTVTNILISHCRFHDNIRWGIEIAANATGSTLKGITVDSISVSNVWQYNFWSGIAGTFPHVDGIIALVGGNPQYTNVTLGSVSQPVIIKNSLFCNNCPYTYDTIPSGGGDAMIFLTGWGGTTLIYNNLFLNTLGGHGAIYCQDGPRLTDGTSLPDYHFYNNSFYDADFSVTLRTVTTGYALTNGFVSVKNNVFYHDSVNAAMPVEFGLDATSMPNELDYNFYFTLRPNTLVAHYWSVKGTYGTINNLQSNGFELHGVYGDPQFANINYGLGTNSSLNNLTLQSGSPAIGAGANLSSYFTTDYATTLRQLNGAWDIGAYQVDTKVGGLPVPPTNLKVLPR